MAAVRFASSIPPSPTEPDPVAAAPQGSSAASVESTGAEALTPNVGLPQRIPPPPVDVHLDEASLTAAPLGNLVSPALRMQARKEIDAAVAEVRARLAADQIVDDVVAPIQAARARVNQLLLGAPSDPLRVLLRPFDELERQARARARTR